MKEKEIKKFVIQEHTQAGQVHWDLMLECSGHPNTAGPAAGDALETYRLELSPEKLRELSGQSTSALKIFDHPVKFLTYEGSVNQGKGTVAIADSGTYRLVSDSGRFRELQFDGKILKGKFALMHIKDNQWQFIQRN